MKNCFLLRGRPRVARGCPDEGRRPDCLHFYRAKCDGQNRCIFTVHASTFAHNPLQNCRRYVLRTAKPLPKDRTASFPFQKPPWVLARAPEKCFTTSRWPRIWPPARIPAFLRCPMASSERAEKLPKSSCHVGLIRSIYIHMRRISHTIFFLICRPPPCPSSFPPPPHGFFFLVGVRGRCLFFIVFF